MTFPHPGRGERVVIRGTRESLASAAVSSDSFAYMWVYRVLPERAEEFVELYGPEGAWVRLFRRAPGYLGTDLYADRDDETRFVSIDRWESEAAFREFRGRFGEEFRRLDREGERLTLQETPIGEFRSV